VLPTARPSEGPSGSPVVHLGGALPGIDPSASPSTFPELSPKGTPVQLLNSSNPSATSECFSGSHSFPQASTEFHCQRMNRARRPVVNPVRHSVKLRGTVSRQPEWNLPVL
jgi:hypothetical protein